MFILRKNFEKMMAESFLNGSANAKFLVAVELEAIYSKKGAVTKKALKEYGDKLMKDVKNIDILLGKSDK